MLTIANIKITWINCTPVLSLNKDHLIFLHSFGLLNESTAVLTSVNVIDVIDVITSLSSFVIHVEPCSHLFHVRRAFL